jgi:hypothetical protein
MGLPGFNRPGLDSAQTFCGAQKLDTAYFLGAAIVGIPPARNPPGAKWR